MTGEYFVVEKVLERKLTSDDGTYQYLVKWEDYSDKDNTWEPMDHLRRIRNLTKKVDEAAKAAEKQRTSSIATIRFVYNHFFFCVCLAGENNQRKKKLSLHTCHSFFFVWEGKKHLLSSFSQNKKLLFSGFV